MLRSLVGSEMCIRDRHKRLPSHSSNLYSEINPNVADDGSCKTAKPCNVNALSSLWRARVAVALSGTPLEALLDDLLTANNPSNNLPPPFSLERASSRGGGSPQTGRFKVWLSRVVGGLLHESINRLVSNSLVDELSYPVVFLVMLPWPYGLPRFFKVRYLSRWRGRSVLK